MHRFIYISDPNKFSNFLEIEIIGCWVGIRRTKLTKLTKDETIRVLERFSESLKGSDLWFYNALCGVRGTSSRYKRPMVILEGKGML